MELILWPNFSHSTEYDEINRNVVVDVVDIMFCSIFIFENCQKSNSISSDGFNVTIYWLPIAPRAEFDKSFFNTAIRRTNMFFQCIYFVFWPTPLRWSDYQHFFLVKYPNALLLYLIFSSQKLWNLFFLRKWIQIAIWFIAMSHDKNHGVSFNNNMNICSIFLQYLHNAKTLNCIKNKRMKNRI